MYREAIDLIVSAIVELQLWTSGAAPPPFDTWKAFEVARLRAHGRFGMLAPQSVLDAFSNLIDYFLFVREGTKAFDFRRARDWRSL
jgi:hypothetical protein